MWSQIGLQHVLGQQEAHYEMTVQATEALFCKWHMNNFLCERPPVRAAFLRVYFFGEDVTIPQEERKEPVVAGCVG